MELTKNARDILTRRYLNKDETPEQRFAAVANRMASVETDSEAWAKMFYTELFDPMLFVPNSPAIKNARTHGCMSACHCMSPEDNRKSIYKVLGDAAEVMAAGGGVGYSFDRLRERGSPVGSAQGIAGGPVSYLRVYSASSAEITQAFRKGANMGQLSIDHPDIREFIHVKDNHRDITNFNLSVQIPDRFFAALIDDDDWDLVSRHPATMGQVVDTVRARDLWDELCQSAWETGDPGVVFIDHVNRTHPNIDRFGPILTSNPCGEEFLENYGSCCLGSIDVSKHLNESRTEFDWRKLHRTVELAVRFLDNVIDVNEFPVPESAEMARATRRIGLGIMGWADALSYMGIPYNSPRALQLADLLGDALKRIAWNASAKLAEEKGPCPGFTTVRNSSVLTFAPTGTISRIADCSSGIEPHFALTYRSKILWDEHGHQVEHVNVPRSLRDSIMRISHIRRIAQGESLKSLGYRPENWLTANEIDAHSHIEMLATFQKHVSNSISKTINLPESATVHDVSNAFKLAFYLRCKSLTVYRNNSRSIQVLNNYPTHNEDCPECDAPLYQYDGCTYCPKCEFSTCGV